MKNSLMFQANRETRLRSILPALLLLAVALAPQALAQTAAPSFAPGTKWSFFSGYGSSHPGWGETETRVETVDILLRHSTIIAKDLGSSWYSGHHSLFVEFPVHYLLDYNDSPMIGLNFLAGYTFTSFNFAPYVFFGGGPVYVDADIPGMGSDWNGNYQIGAGVSFEVSERNRLFLEARYHHISNGNTSDPNDPLNSTKFLLGISF